MANRDDVRGEGGQGRRRTQGSSWEDAPREDGGYGSQDSGALGYGGQEYGMESRRGAQGQGYQSEPWERSRDWDQPREQWRREGDAPYGDLELNTRNRGVQEYGAPHDYAYHPQVGHEFDPDHLNCRDEQMRSQQSAPDRTELAGGVSADATARKLRAEADRRRRTGS